MLSNSSNAPFSQQKKTRPKRRVFLSFETESSGESKRRITGSFTSAFLASSAGASAAAGAAAGAASSFLFFLFAVFLSPPSFRRQQRQRQVPPLRQVRQRRVRGGGCLRSRRCLVSSRCVSSRCVNGRGRSSLRCVSAAFAAASPAAFASPAAARG